MYVLYNNKTETLACLFKYSLCKLMSAWLKIILRKYFSTEMAFALRLFLNSRQLNRC